MVFGKQSELSCGLEISGPNSVRNTCEETLGLKNFPCVCNWSQKQVDAELK